MSRKYGRASAKRSPTMRSRLRQSSRKTLASGPRAGVCGAGSAAAATSRSWRSRMAAWLASKFSTVSERLRPSFSSPATASVKTGVSSSERRIHRPTASTTAESQNGTRQPHDWSWASSSVYTQANTRVMRICAEKPPVFGHDV
ncbi:Uncharacterised protein [Mycobacteroides abscessus]|nr:Uncharacterised protein [Mycobacteroides abscessus]